MDLTKEALHAEYNIIYRIVIYWIVSPLYKHIICLVVFWRHFTAREFWRYCFRFKWILTNIYTIKIAYTPDATILKI